MEMEGTTLTTKDFVLGKDWSWSSSRYSYLCWIWRWIEWRSNYLDLELFLLLLPIAQLMLTSTGISVNSGALPFTNNTGTVTSVATGNGLTGGTVTTTLARFPFKQMEIQLM